VSNSLVKIDTFACLFSLGDQFPARADGTVTALGQAGRQAAALAVSVGMAIVGGLVTGNSFDSCRVGQTVTRNESQHLCT
jgi:hypothetical protein